MAINTYATLESAVGNWLARDNLTLRIPEFITLGEARIGREVRSRLQEQRATAAAAEYINVPSDFLALRSLWFASGGVIYQPRYLTPDALFMKYPSTATGIPKHYTIIGDEIRFGPPPDSAYTIELWYWKRLVALSSALNTLFTDNPDLYLYAALTTATPFLKNDARIVVWAGLYTAIKDQLNASEKAGREGVAMAVTPE